MRAAYALLGIVFCSMSALALQPPEQPTGAPHITTYLETQRHVVPGATVISGFHDHRDVSKYRKHAGEHLGYDVAMPVGSSVVVGWSGQVVRIVPWYGKEYGITVQSPDGYETTYGHLKPRVAMGDQLQRGDAVGTTLINHVDIKVRSPDGLYYDFGSNEVAHQASTRPGSPATVALDRAEVLRRYLRARYSVDLTREEAERAVAGERAAREALERHRDDVEKAQRRLGLHPSDARKVMDRLRDLADSWRRQHDQYSRLCMLLVANERALIAARAELRRYGLPRPALRHKQP